MSGNPVQHAIKNWTQSDLRFCKNEGFKRYNINKNGVNWVKNAGER